MSLCALSPVPLRVLQQHAHLQAAEEAHIQLQQEGEHLHRGVPSARQRTSKSCSGRQHARLERRS